MAIIGIFLIASFSLFLISWLVSNPFFKGISISLKLLDKIWLDFSILPPHFLPNQHEYDFPYFESSFEINFHLIRRLQPSEY